MTTVTLPLKSLVSATVTLACNGASQVFTTTGTTDEPTGMSLGTRTVRRSGSMRITVAGAPPMVTGTSPLKPVPFT
ncbi:hypothetical protein D3C72_927150 [compost metagenome]